MCKKDNIPQVVFLNMKNTTIGQIAKIAQDKYGFDEFSISHESMLIYEHGLLKFKF